MPSFISSFRGIAASAAICVALYCLAVQVAGLKILVYADQFLANIARAEQVMAADDQLSAVLVGSSLAARLPENLWADDMMNVSFAGHSALNGLELAAQSNVWPKTVLIETNWLPQKTTLSFTDQLTHSLLYPVRPYVKGLQVENQPINILATLAFRLSRTPPGPESCADVVEPLDAADTAPNTAAQFFSAPPFSEAEIALALDTLAVAVARLEERGSTVLLVEFPVDAAFGRAEGPTKLRKAIAARFPNLTFWRFETHPFQTTDGQHLTADSAERFGCVLVNRLSALER